MDRASDPQRTILEFDDIMWLTPTQVEVSAGGGTYYLWKVAGYWKVYGFEPGQCACG